MPVPIVIPTTLRPPRAAPCHHSPSVAQFASLSSVAGRFTRSAISSRSGKSFHPRFGVTMHDALLAVERARRADADAEEVARAPRRSRRDVQDHVLDQRRDPLRHRRQRRRRLRVGIVRIAISRLPSTGIAPATMFVPPRSTPMMYCSRVMRARLRRVTATRTHARNLRR